MEFTCCRMINEEYEQWKGKIIAYERKSTYLEMQVESRSSLHIIIGICKHGNYVCIPNFNTSCYLSYFSDTFWNTEKLSALIGEVDGITAAKAIEYINMKINLWDSF